MKFSFDPALKLIVVLAAIHTRNEVVFVKLGLDTGASHTTIQPDLIQRLGMDIPDGQVSITFGTKSKTLPLFRVSNIKSLGKVRDDLLIVSHALPPAFQLDGLLGLDFLRPFEMRVDFPNGTIELL